MLPIDLALYFDTDGSPAANFSSTATQPTALTLITTFTLTMSPSWVRKDLITSLPTLAPRYLDRVEGGLFTMWRIFLFQRTTNFIFMHNFRRKPSSLKFFLIVEQLPQMQPTCFLLSLLHLYSTKSIGNFNEQLLSPACAPKTPCVQEASPTWLPFLCPKTGRKFA